jgi:MarR family transcriptional regulator, transcriptional regulator for hemolysin
MAQDGDPFRIDFLIHDVARLRHTVFDKVLRTIGVTRSQWWVLANLSRHHGEPIIQTKLAQFLDLGKVSLVGLIDRLEVIGLVERKLVTSDRRVKVIVMTPRGVKLLEEMRALAAGVNSQIMKGISCEDIAYAERVLHDMKNRLRDMDAVPSRRTTPQLGARHSPQHVPMSLTSQACPIAHR